MMAATCHPARAGQGQASRCAALHRHCAGRRSGSRRDEGFVPTSPAPPAGRTKGKALLSWRIASRLGEKFSRVSKINLRSARGEECLRRLAFGIQAGQPGEISFQSLAVGGCRFFGRLHHVFRQTQNDSPHPHASPATACILSRILASMNDRIHQVRNRKGAFIAQVRIALR